MREVHSTVESKKLANQLFSAFCEARESSKNKQCGRYDTVVLSKDQAPGLFHGPLPPTFVTGCRPSSYSPPELTIKTQWVPWLM